MAQAIIKSASRPVAPPDEKRRAVWERVAGRGSTAALCLSANYERADGNGRATRRGNVHALDTNAIIYYDLAGDAGAVAVFRNVFAGRDPVYVSTITDAELLSFRGDHGSRHALD